MVMQETSRWTEETKFSNSHALPETLLAQLMII